jgi:hypothetical protein
MIIKELEQLEAKDRREQAGYDAEFQLAFYLRRAFKDDPNLLVFNNLRFEKAGDVCQIDHLILHPFGIILIESKSVTTRVQINELGEWTRSINGLESGMPSPILQAQRQGDFLHIYLEESVESLLSKRVLLGQSHFTKMPIDILVAISDSGIIDRTKSKELDCVCKAERITERIKDIYTKYLKADSVFALSLMAPFSFNQKEMSRISQFLVNAHKPKDPQTHQTEKPKIVSSPSVISAQKGAFDLNRKSRRESNKTAETQFCPGCHSQNLDIWYSYSYFFKCLDCRKNITIKNFCPTCGNLEKIRKSGIEFFSECEKCSTSKRFHQNSAIK